MRDMKKVNPRGFSLLAPQLQQGHQAVVDLAGMKKVTRGSFEKLLIPTT
jgi:hypothetical protein